MTWTQIAIAFLWWLVFGLMPRVNRGEDRPVSDNSRGALTKTPNRKPPQGGSGTAPPKDRRPDAPHIPS